MKVVKIILNLLGIFVAILLSLLLSAMLLVTPVVSAVTTFFNADNLHKIADQLQVSDLVRSYAGTALKNAQVGGIDTATVNTLLETELVDDIIALYIDGFFTAIEGDSSQADINKEAIKTIVTKHSDELLPTIESYLGTDLPLTEENLQLVMKPMMDSVITNITSMLPSFEDLGLDFTIISVLRKLHKGTYLIYTLCATAVLSLFILLLRFPRFKGFMWLGVVYLLSALLLLLPASLTRVSDMVIPPIEDIPTLQFITTPLLATLSTEFFKTSGVAALLGVVFILVFVFGRKHLRQRKTTLTTAA
ncbi:MAG: hypothetical protein IJ379_09660 [Lachnospiraceae bacterium]|nr:hypothetical protein [Lachnospiraceae bacterium]